MPRPRKKIPLEVEKAIRALAQEGYAPSQILAYVQRKYPDQTEKLDAKTVQRRVKEYGPPDDSEPWTLATAPPAEAAVVMPVLGAMLAETAAMLAQDDPLLSAMARSRRLTVGLAKWILKVAAAAPTLPPYEQYIVAREYRAAELSAARGVTRPYLTDHASLDAFLACRPWESEEAAERYERLLEMGIVKQPIYMGKWWRNILEREQIRRRLAELRQQGQHEREQQEADHGSTTREG